MGLFFSSRFLHKNFQSLIITFLNKQRERFSVVGGVGGGAVRVPMQEDFVKPVSFSKAFLIFCFPRKRFLSVIFSQFLHRVE